MKRYEPIAVPRVPAFILLMITTFAFFMFYPVLYISLLIVMWNAVADVLRK
jgi:hypothetical protein